MSQNNLLFKYGILGVVICGLVVLIPRDRISLKDTLLLSIVLTLCFLLTNSLSLFNSDSFDPTVTVPQTSLDQVIAAVSRAIQPSQPVQLSQSFPPIQPPVNTTVANQSPSQCTPVQTPRTPVQNANNLNNIPVDATVQPGSTMYVNQPNANEKEVIGSRATDGIITSDMPFTDYHHLPMADDYKPSSFEYGYSFLPPEKWYPTPPFPPVCVSEKRCPVCPVFTTGTPTNVKEWAEATKILPPDGINTQYIKSALNAGK
jgi:hypothetical protein